MELDEFVDGDLKTNPVFVCQTENREEEGFEVLRLLHNYLSSLYSLNETIRVLINQHTERSVEIHQRQFANSGEHSTLPYYSRRLTFLRGLRTDFQHGGFSCLAFNRKGSLGDFGGYHVVFDRDSFINDSGLRSPEGYLKYTNESNRRYPLCYVGSFQQETVQEFYNDIEDWFGTA
ncbi:hypothetical protein [Halobacterium noricense]|uniref:hypothetical protein n=1 Tax=Halobacterium noricense TaxID=223182 RepID=UPI001E34663F|nr:hypothetical protein [Halobacterium noricense]UHH25014.1 hypothetical protein LT974_13645 [Halobacterium noricense]